MANRKQRTRERQRQAETRPCVRLSWDEVEVRIGALNVKIRNLGKDAARGPGGCAELPSPALMRFGSMHAMKQDMRFGAALQKARYDSRLPMDMIERWSGLTQGRIVEMESGAPPSPTEAEIHALELVYDVGHGSLWKLRPDGRVLYQDSQSAFVEVLDDG